MAELNIALCKIRTKNKYINFTLKTTKLKLNNVKIHKNQIKISKFKKHESDLSEIENFRASSKIQRIYRDLKLQREKSKPLVKIK